MGWLSAIPESENKDGKVTRWPHSRWTQIVDEEGGDPELPDDAESYLIRGMLRAGPTIPMGGGGLRPLDWQDIWHWSLCTGEIEDPWEFEVIYDLSNEFFTGLEEGKNVLSIMPTRREED